MKWLLRAAPGIAIATIQMYRSQDPVTHNNLSASLEVVVLGTMLGIAMAMAFIKVTGQDKD